jgi:hypothetical protein
MQFHLETKDYSLAKMITIQAFMHTWKQTQWLDKWAMGDKQQNRWRNNHISYKICMYGKERIPSKFAEAT